MPPPLLMLPKRTRESTSKVRTGCLTCKARRIKCDEGKPICRRCIVGYRKCEYDTARFPAGSRRVFTIYLPPAAKQPAPFANSDELDFFHRKLAAKLDWSYDSKFWAKLVLQLSHSEPSIKHALSAVSITHKDVEASMTSESGYTTADPAAMREWNLAMQSLSARIRDKPSSHLVPLVCCLIFTCIEFLKGSVDSALVHVQSGFKILTTIRSNLSGAGQAPHIVPDDDIKTIEEHIVPMFSRLNSLCTLFGRATPPILALNDRPSSKWENFEDARQQLYETVDPAMRFIRSAGRKAESFELSMDDFAEQVKLQTSLEEWRTAFDVLLADLEARDTLPDKRSVNLLLCSFLVVYTWLGVCTTAEETAIDAYYTSFLELVECAAEATKENVEPREPQLLSFEMQVIGPLYYTAVKCRDPALRRRALNLLKLAPRREGLWNAHHAYVTAKRIIELEEAALPMPQGLPSEGGRLRGVNLPSDEDRVYNSSQMPGERRKFDVTIVPSPDMPGVIEVMFQTKPAGPLGPWHTFTEQLVL